MGITKDSLDIKMIDMNLSIRDIMALSIACRLGIYNLKSAEGKRLLDIFSRIDKKLTTKGFPRPAVERICKLI